MSSGRARSVIGPDLRSGARALAAPRGDPHALEHGVRLVFGHGVLEREVAGDEPHDVVPGFVFVAGFVTSVRFEQAPRDVVDRGTADVLDEQCLEVGNRDEPQHAAESLDRTDASERADGRFGHAVTQQELGLLDVGEVLGPRVERDVEDRGRELLAPLRLPRFDGRRAKPGAR